MQAPSTAFIYKPHFFCTKGHNSIGGISSCQARLILVWQS